MALFLTNVPVPFNISGIAEFFGAMLGVPVAADSKKLSPQPSSKVELTFILDAL